MNVENAMTTVFSAPLHGITISRDSNGSWSWVGRYLGAGIRAVVPSQDGTYCILLLDPDANNEPKFENLLAIGRNGVPIWTAKLPTSPDVFVELHCTREGIWGATWSGMRILLDMATGAELRREFAK